MMKRKKPKFTLKEGLKESTKMRKGVKHLTEDYYAKVGFIRPCHKCGVPVDVISYGGFMLDQMSITSCPKHEHKFRRSNCTSKICGVHGGENGFDEEKYIEDSKRISYTRREIKKMLEKVKPKNDSILEYDRMSYLFGHSHSKMRSKDYDYWLYTGFIDYFGLKGKLRI